MVDDLALIDWMLRRYRWTRRPGDYPPARLIIRAKQRVDLERLERRIAQILSK